LPENIQASATSLLEKLNL